MKSEKQFYLKTRVDSFRPSKYWSLVLVFVLSLLLLSQKKKKKKSEIVYPKQKAGESEMDPNGQDQEGSWPRGGAL